MNSLFWKDYMSFTRFCFLFQLQKKKQKKKKKTNSKKTKNKTKKTKNNSNNKKLFLKKGPSFLKWTLVNYYLLLAIFSNKFPHRFQFNLTNWKYKDFIYRKHPLCLVKNQFSPQSCNSGVTTNRQWTKTTSRN